ncbi:DNA repair protein complementing XP-C cells homolog [Leguminivora glycinivorella]|uniref:DNA repair protein complementing XP-C cells homolog n=1 Tax=Leguminivora glycinivorella TaxID=1035111 RepID=UPI00200DE8B2|nr:DNA repair protein complementing XP-C cells homolog [Leguminivora glycinivorella]
METMIVTWMWVDDSYFSDTNIMQVDGNDDGNIEAKSRKTRRSQAPIATEQTEMDEDVSPPKRTRRSAANPSNSEPSNIVSENKTSPKTSNRKVSEVKSKFKETKPVKVEPNKASSVFKKLSLNRHCKANKENEPKESKHEISSSSQESPNKKKTAPEQSDPPKIIVTNEKNKAVFESNSSAELSKCTTRSRSKNADVKNMQNAKDSINNNTKTRSKSAGTSDSSSTFVESNTAQNKSATRSRSKPVDVKNVQNVKAFVDTNTKTRSKNADTTETGTTFIESNTAQSKPATRSRSKTANLRTVQIAKDHVNKNTKTRSKSAGTSDSSSTIFESNTAKNKSTTRSRSKTADLRNIQNAKDPVNKNTKTRSKSAGTSDSCGTIFESNTAKNKSTTRSRSKTADVINIQNAKDPVNKNTKTRSKSAGTSDSSSTIFKSNTAKNKSTTRSRSKTADVRNIQNAKDPVNKNTKTRSKSAGTSDSSSTIFERNTAQNKSATRSRSKTADVNNVQNAKDSRDTNTKTRSKNADISETGSTLVASNSNTAQSKFTTRSRSKTADVKNVLNAKDSINNNTKTRSKSAGTSETSKYLNDSEKTPIKIDPKKTKKTLKDMDDELRGRKTKISPKNAVRMEESLKNKAVKKKSVKGKSKTKSDSDYEPEALSDDDFKPSKISPKPSGSRKIDRRVLSTDDEAPRDKTDVWCEVFVEELEQWIAVDVVKGQVHCTNEIYSRATHPVCYVVGWDNNNYLKDLTRRYVPHWNTVTRKQRAEPVWWDTAISPWKGPRMPRDREEDEALDRMQLDAPLPTSIAEYKNHPLYVLKRHLLKYEALYPPKTATLGFVRGEAVYPRDSVCVCHSRHTWYKLAKVVRQGEQPYKIVKANPRWDKAAKGADRANDEFARRIA